MRERAIAIFPESEVAPRIRTVKFEGRALVRVVRAIQEDNAGFMSEATVVAILRFCSGVDMGDVGMGNVDRRGTLMYEAKPPPEFMLLKYRSCPVISSRPTPSAPGIYGRVALVVV